MPVPSFLSHREEGRGNWIKSCWRPPHQSEWTQSWWRPQSLEEGDAERMEVERVCSVFQRSQALHWCQLPHRDGRWSFGSRVFLNAPKVCALVRCFHVVTHPSVGRGSAGHVRKGGPLGRSRTTGGGPVTGLLAGATSAALPGARHLGDIVTREEEVEEEGIVDKPFIHGR